MIQQSVECKRIGNEYVDLFRKLLQYINYTNFSKDFITDDDLKMLSELEFYISSGKYEIIEFGTRKSPFDVREKLEELEEKNKTFEDYNKDLNNQLDKLQQKIDKVIEYIEDIEEDKEVDNLFIKKKEKSFLVFYKIKNDLLKILKGE